MKKLIVVLMVALMSFALAGILAGCTGNDGGEANKPPAGVTGIQVFKQNAGGVDISNYQVDYKHTPDEWNALSDNAREKLVSDGYSYAKARIAEDKVGNYNITGNTALGVDETSQLAFILDHENSTLLIFGAEGQTGEIVLDPS